MEPGAELDLLIHKKVMWLMKMSDRPLVLYHADCWDGFCAAWVAHKALAYPQSPEFIPVRYGQPPPDVRGREVYMFDFSYPRDVMEKLIADAAGLLCLDHHKSAAEILAGLPRCLFDMEKSGGRLAWELFFPGDTAPWLVNYTEDRDLWRWDLQDSRAVNASLRSHPLDFKLWDRFERSPFFDHVIDGRAILRRERQIIDEHIRHAREVAIAGHKVLSANATVLFSEIAGELAKDRPFGVAWFERQDGKRQYSLRSDPAGVDVSEVAKQFGGGGHEHAAGYEV